MEITVRPIGFVRASLVDVSGAPSQASGAADVQARIEVDVAFVDGLLGLDRYPYLWLVTWLHDQPAAGPADLQLVPRALEAEGRVQGVFASRAPRRPNPIGLSLVRNLGVEGAVISFAGVDVVDGTPVLDIKPWFDDCDLPTTVS